MSARLALAGLLLVAPVRAQENRLWLVDLELEGPLEALVLDCGSAGATRVEAGLVAGERRNVAVPVPARVPLGVDALASSPLPELRSVVGEGGARLTGWSRPQPVERTEVRRDWLSRPRPPVVSGGTRPGAAAVALAAAGFLLAVAGRRRPVRALVVGGVAAGLVGGLAATRTGPAAGILLLEAGPWERALAIRSALSTIPLPRDRLEVVPAASPLELDLVLAGGELDGSVTAEGARLHGFEVVPAPALSPRENAHESLAASWVRAPGGGWEAHGAWERGAPLPPLAAAGDPPGWLGAGLPPGRPVLVGGLTGGEVPTWIRIVGFGERD